MRYEDRGQNSLQKTEENAQMLKGDPHSASRVAVHVSIMELHSYQREAFMVA